MAPYLSVIVTARNDDHGGNLLERMQAFVNGLLNQCAHHEIPAELIIVEWNPPQDRPRLAQALHWGAANEHCYVRIIEVPPELHRRFRHWQELPLYQMIAKNVGIRRARGEFILSTNIDIIFSNELMSFIGARRLEPGKMYRINRWDVRSEVPVEASIHEQLAYCKTHLIRVNSREGTYRVSADGSPIYESKDIYSPTSGLQLGSRWFPREMLGDEPFRWVDTDAELVIQGCKGSKNVLVLDVEPGPGVNLGAFPLQLCDAVGNQLGLVWVKRRTIVRFPLQPSDAGAARVRLRPDRGGTRIASDPRMLNFRVFRCEIESAPAAASIVAKLAPDSAQVRSAQSWTSRLGRGFKLLRNAFRSSVQIRAPIPKDALERLELRQDEDSVSFFVAPLTGLFKRRRSRIVAEILSPELGAIWGEGWYPLEHFAGETFRWMKHHGALVLSFPSSPVSAVSLLVEAGPAVGFGPVELEVRDQWESLLAKATIKGRTKVDVPLSKVSGSFALSVCVDGGQPRAVRGDSRTMALKLFRCESAPSGETKAPGIDPFEVAPGWGIWCVGGWTKGAMRDAKGGIVASSGAELVLRTPSKARSKAILEVEVTGNATLNLVVGDAYDRELFQGRIKGAREISIPDLHPPGAYCVLRFEMHGADEPDGEEALLALLAVVWAGEDGGEPMRVPIYPQDRNEGAVHLHTNACGDFTLLGRDHWMDLRGYPELDVFSMHVDSLFCWTAHHGGVREKFLDSPMRIFHIEHATGSGWTPEGQDKLYERISAKGIPWLSYNDVIQWACVMNRFDAPMIFNHEDWGFATEALHETLPGKVC